MTTITNNWGDSATVGRGGIGDDNVTGTVTDKDGNLVPGARVKVNNITNGAEGLGKTDATGGYDIDADAKKGDRIHIHIEWKDAAGRWHVITDIVTINGEEDEKQEPSTPKIETPEDHLRVIEEMENHAMRLSLESTALDKAMIQLYGVIQSDMIRFMDSLRQLDENQQRIMIDKMMVKEIKDLIYKYLNAKRSKRIPTPSEQWAILEEMLQILMKLIYKVFLLQHEKPPDFRPKKGYDIA